MNQNEGMLTAEPPAGMELDSALGKQERGLLRGMLVLDALFLAMCVMFILLAPAGLWRNQVMGVQLWRNVQRRSGLTRARRAGEFK